MTIKITESQIKRDAKKIKTLPSLRSVRALKFKKNRDYNKFVKWIGSSSQALKKATPDKKEIKKIGLGVGGFFGGGFGSGGGLLVEVVDFLVEHLLQVVLLVVDYLVRRY